MFSFNIDNQFIREFKNGVQLYIKREDTIHPFISGNKYRKLKYNIEEAKNKGFDNLLSFGGAYSNHISALAYAGKISGFATVGIIRGEELRDKIHENPTLRFANSCGMNLIFVTREDYGKKFDDYFLNSLKKRFNSPYIIPEGGANSLAVKGCEEILTSEDKVFDHIICSAGTGGTIAGIINSCAPNQKILGFPALKGDFLKKDILKFATQGNWDLVNDYHFGGYAKINKELIAFINDFKTKYYIPLDPIYTGKMMYGIFDLIKKGYFLKDSKILAIHTGGLQGIKGMNKKLQKKGLPLLKV